MLSRMCVPSAANPASISSCPIPISTASTVNDRAVTNATRRCVPDPVDMTCGWTEVH